MCSIYLFLDVINLGFIIQIISSTHIQYDSPSRGSLPDAEKRGNGSASAILTKVIITRVSQI